MTLHRFFLPEDSFRSATVVFTSELSHQIRNVLRLGRDDRVTVLDGHGQEFLVRLDRIEKKVTGVVEERGLSAGEPRVALTIYQGILKGSKFEFIAQKCTEIGVSRFVPLKTSRSVAGEPTQPKQRRMEAIVREAAEQSGRGKIPTLGPAISFGEAAQEACRAGPALLFWEGEQAQHLRDIEFENPITVVSVFIGPEGGFTAGEAQQAQCAGLRLLTLGKRILRSETAAIVSSGLVLEKLGELG